MQEKVYNILSQIEEYIDRSFPVLGVFCIVKKSELYDKLKLLFDSMPKELVDNKDYVLSSKDENVFALLNKMSYEFSNLKTLYGFSLVNKSTVTNYLDKMYVLLAEDIHITRERSL